MLSGCSSRKTKRSAGAGIALKRKNCRYSGLFLLTPPSESKPASPTIAFMERLREDAVRRAFVNPRQRVAIRPQAGLRDQRGVGVVRVRPPTHDAVDPVQRVLWLYGFAARVSAK